MTRDSGGAPAPSPQRADELGAIFGTAPLLSASIRVTRECNLACSFCYVYSLASRGRRSPDELTEVEIGFILSDLRDLGCTNVFVTGGEPFLRRGIGEILRAVKASGMDVAVSSNGTTLSPPLLTSVHDIGFAMFQVSADGPPRRHDAIRGRGTFERVRRSMDLLERSGYPNRTLCCTLTTANADVFPEMVDVARNLRATHFSITMAVAGGRAARANTGAQPVRDAHVVADALAGFFDRYRASGAPFLFSRTGTVPIALVPPDIVSEQGPDRFLMCSFPYLVGIDADGSVAPCDGFFGQGRLVMGNVRQRRLTDIWNDKRFTAIRNLGPDDLTGVCSICRWRTRCGGGCRAAAAAEFDGDLTAPDPVCQAFFVAGRFPAEAFDAECSSPKVLRATGKRESGAHGREVRDAATSGRRHDDRLR